MAQRERIQKQVLITKRAFRQDAAAAMRNDIVRGLIEAITNADDAYGDASGRILIRVFPKSKNHNTWHASVSDRAGGIAPSELETKLLHAGERTSGHEQGLARRGNRGRGAKDLCAFGGVLFETISDGAYSSIRLNKSGIVTEEHRRKATNQEREALGVPRTGTRVTIECYGSVRRPRFETLRSRLTAAVALRKILQNPLRTVLLEDDERREELKYVAPKAAETVFVGELDVAGYGSARLELYAAGESLPRGSDGSGIAGIVITSGAASHEATLFGYDANPYAETLFGTLDMPAIDDLARDVDEREEADEPLLPDNPLPIISRTRDGLEHSHPAYRALKAAVLPTIEAFVRERAAAQRSLHETELTRRTNEAMARALSRWFSKQEEELDVEAREGMEPENAFVIIPPKKNLELGASHTFTLQCPVGMLRGESAAAQIELEESVAGLLHIAETVVTMARSERRTDVARGTILVTAGSTEGEAIITARLFVGGVQVASAAAEIDCVQPAIKPAPPAPDCFKFEQSSYVVAPGKRRKLVLQAPREICEKLGTDVRIICEDDRALTIHGNRLELRLTRYGWYEAVVEVEGKQRGARVAIVGRIHGQILKAETELYIRDNSGPNVRIQVDAFDGPYRALYEEGETEIVVRINARHPALRRYFGPEPGFALQDCLPARLLKAEVVADEAVRSLQRKRAERLGSEELDVERLYAQRASMIAELLPQLHQTQVADAEIKELEAAEAAIAAV